MKPKLVTILSSLLFAIILWVFVSFSQEYTTTFNVPVEIINVKPGYSIASTSTSNVTLSIKGLGWTLSKISFGPQTSFSIPSKNKIGLQSCNLRDAISDNDWIGSSVQVVMVSPPEIKFKIEKTLYKTVPIEQDLSIEVDKGFGLVSEIRLFPDSVKIWGPKSLIKGIKKISTVKQSFPNCNEQISQQIALAKIDFINYAVNNTLVEFDVQKIVDKSFANIPIQVTNVPNLRKLELFPPEIEITLRGGLENLGRSSADDIKATVDFKDAFQDTLGFVKPHIIIPDFTTLINVKPEKLDYIIKQY